MTITEYVESLLRNCKRYPSEAFLHQAYGAINYHIMAREHNPKEDNELYERWETEWKPEFEKLIWGI